MVTPACVHTFTYEHTITHSLTIVHTHTQPCSLGLPGQAPSTPGLANSEEVFPQPTEPDSLSGPRHDLPWGGPEMPNIRVPAVTPDS